MCRGEYRVGVAGDDVVGLPRIIDAGTFVAYPAFDRGRSHQRCTPAIVAGIMLTIAWTISTSLLNNGTHLFEA